ncbi:murein-DD-endopeptidase [Burkholderia pseudomallei]|uniref:serine hydrolase n=1 Tax=Burkholderia pseudomallei TaxID=28450 RepID=UPI000977575C|nr:serine hydrolase [Burkholderia pseudomallei]NVI00535.1 D-alanyl-D-alanine carboxypeptidase [Burkholderia pseudomallei]NVI27733.1 D-alanyl-D-alanine carboxypeptidase [Burkholderia pseudomallei]OMV64037.1 D-alanyl-D-alanine carboxypeptidase [Burkholderia pseudomallei]OMV73917.1 D-alanyl-D-alanine carboxypeptidase [Burkholderia pseudomallei]OMV90193.1 D-alanyl-D-alanine carboxypeptidase [Burkholderia pseudomallei]
MPSTPHHPSRLPVRLLFAVCIVWIASVLGVGFASPAHAAGKACARTSAAHGHACRSARAAHAKHAQRAARARHHAPHAKHKRAAIPGKAGHRARTAAHRHHPKRKRPRAARDTVVAAAKPQLLARCGYTAASRHLLRSRAIYVVDERTGTVLIERNANRVMPIASVTKLMTSMVALDTRAPMSRPLRVSAQDRDYEKFTGSRLKVGSVLSRRDMLHIALMSSENRAAAALSRDYPGGRPAFVAAMNRKARTLGMKRTHFVNATGLSPRNVSTARGLSRLVAAASRYPRIKTFSTATSKTVFPGRGQLRYVNSDALVRAGDSSIVLQKTGFINEAGHCVVLRYAVRGRPVDIVLLGAPGPHDHVADAAKIRRWLTCSMQ